ncbi:MAG: 50S ribosomal protein L16 [Candidatus Jacksonbacteria bacterium RIFOXYC2_FULL_44_29]|nr:MAG: 50S ribosomal protein L16 [Parcubacteria group bacterium GW2011_GWA2_42_28]KKT56213.1 MAG: 50S ribosomal protein L16 [Parcubacteria group bacterium GW2011_GWC2_44_22]OGY76137.1 MAG: 50S ribosomal protein L16 [Candidatus Jacksonbacteria bacterium RIFOXYA2_FULL_43_12]OGY77727.1 MAG: 50S ribosomal protein L16 [Candidatus Jacksonbacteria bacterium RIFOXYB2_FULL_44_15]OGY78864.1 MAG: 50S ribosomal protein L16 [Candidatus Jacksonbacteria bacterium RIFOXYD2_FULL_43_21]OGY80203.1 MAG: 50S ribo
MLLPKKLKHRKWHRHSGMSGGKVATRTNSLAFGNFGLKATTESWVNSRQIEATRRAVRRSLQKGGKIWLRIFPDKPVTAKGNEIPMGGGKGNIDRFVTNVKPGTIILEIDGVTKKLAEEAARLGGAKLPVRTKFVSKITY